MATVPDSQGVQRVEPDTRLPDDYQHIDAKPEQFGGLIAQGLEKAGQGATQASDNLFNIAAFQGKINVDDQSNKWLETHNKILYGDPNKPQTGPDGQPAVGPDGKPVADKGFMGLSGRDASDQRAATLKELEDQRLAGRENLASPKEKLEYDMQTRRMYSQAEERIGAHTEQQWKVWAGGVNGSGAKLALDAIAANPNDAQSMAHNSADLINFRVQEAQIKFGDDPQVKKEAIAAAKQEALKAQTEAIAVHDPSRALDIVEKNKTIAGTLYDDLANKFRARALQADGRTIGTNKIAQAAVASQPVFAGPNGSVNGAQTMLRNFEGFKTDAYWDVNHWRVGYGSDTITKADGTVVPVTQDTKVTQADAERDLQRRTVQFQQTAKGQIGDVAWQGLSPQAQAAITSVAYNYGRVPTAVAAAAQSGDPEKLSQAILGLSTDNGGVNANRRAAEAGAVVGRNVPALKASAFQLALSDPNISPEQLPHVLQFITQQMHAQEIAENQSAAARKKDVDEAIGGYTKQMWDMAHSPNPDWVALAGQINHDPRLDTAGPAKDGIMDRIIKRSGEEQSLAFGPGYMDVKARIISEPGTPGHIASLADIYKLPLGQLTAAGEHELQTVMAAVKKSPDQAGVQRTMHSLEDYAKKKLSFDQEMLIPGVPQSMARDPKGEAIFSAQFLPMFEKAFGKHVADGKDPYEFLTKESVDKMVSGMRSQQEMAEARMRATNGLGELQPPAPPPKGANVAPEVWSALTEKPAALSDGTPITKMVWANGLALLATHPTQAAVDGFNRTFGRQDGAQILKQLTGKDTGAPAAPKAAAEPAQKSGAIDIPAQAAGRMAEVNAYSRPGGTGTSLPTLQ